MQPLLQPTSIDVADNSDVHDSVTGSFIEPPQVEVQEPRCDVDVVIVDADVPEVDNVEEESLVVEPPEAFTIPKEVEVDMSGAAGGAEVGAVGGARAPLIVEIDDQGK